jgi:hypothetical protein
MVASPGCGLRLLKWSCRSPWRFGGLVAVMWVCYEILMSIGAFESVHRLVVSFYTQCMMMRSTLVGGNAWLSEWNERLVSSYEFIQQYVEPWKIPVGIIALFLILLWMQDLETSLTPMVTPEGSPISSLCSTPPEDAQTLALQHMDSAMKNQVALMERVVVKLVALKGRVRQEEDRQREQELVMKGRLESHADGQKDLWMKSNQSWDEIKSRLDQFEMVLKGSRADSAGGPRLVDQNIQGGNTAGGPSLETIHGSVGGPSPASGEESHQSSAVRRVIIKKLTREPRTPKEIFVAALKEFREVDKEVWATHFPPGFRERVSPQVLGEIYANGTAKEWAKEWIKSKELSECDEARQVIPTCAALDSILLVDQVRDAINQVNTEKMARKVLGIRSAYKDVFTKSDWKGGRAAVWKSMVDMEAWKRTDPGLGDQEHIFMNRKAEDEMRGEMDREASMLKALSKLSEQGSSS